MSDWVDKQIKLIRTLRKSRILKWACIEMAFNEPWDDGALDADSEIIWSHKSVPYLQFSVLGCLVGDKWFCFKTYESDSVWGIYLTVESEAPVVTGERGSIYRSRELPELPIGKVHDLGVMQNESGDLTCIELLRLGGKTVSLYSGEIYAQDNGGYAVIMMDESILIQVDGRLPV